MNAEHVAGLHGNLVRVHDSHQLIVPNESALRAVVGEQIDQHAPALHAGLGHMLDPEIARAWTTWIFWTENINARAVAVVIDDLIHTILVYVERLRDMAQRIPLRRILGPERDRVVAGEVGPVLVLEAKRKVDEVIAFVPRLDPAFGRMSLRHKQVAARKIKRQAKAEGEPFLDLFGGLLAPFGRNQIEPADLIILAKVAPV